MSRERLRISAAIALLSELSDEEVIGAEAAARLDKAAVPGDNIPLEEIRRRCGL